MTPLWCVLLPVAVEVVWVFVLHRYRQGESRIPGSDAEAWARERRDRIVMVAFLVYHWPLVPVALAVQHGSLPGWALLVALFGVAAIYAGLLLWLRSLM